MQDNLSPKLILFREVMVQILDNIKRLVKKTALDDIDLILLLSKDTAMDPTKYHEYILPELNNLKVRDTVLALLQKLYREDLVGRRRLPDTMIESILRVTESQGQLLSVAKLFGALLTNENTLISNADKEKALMYLVEANKNKAISSGVQAIMLDVFSFLAPRNEPEIKRFLAYYMNWILNELDFHNSEEDECRLTLHKHDKGEYGRCFMCNKVAFNFHKEMEIPICSLACKASFSELQARSEHREIFNLFEWLISQSVKGDQMIFRQIQKELRAVIKGLTEKQLRVLFPQLLMHAKSGNRQMALVCHRIFVGLFSGHKQMLRKELGSYLKEMNLQLESAKEHSEIYSLLQLFQELFKYPDNISWIYANYDCKYYEINLLEEQLALLSKISMGEDTLLAQQAKTCLVVLVKSLIESLRSGIIRANSEMLDNEDLLEERKVKERADQGIRLFNSKPKVGIEYLKENYFTGQEMRVEDLAKFIRQNESTEGRTASSGRLKLKKDKIGEFFCQNKPLNIEVYKAFVELLDFEGLTIDDALRELLSHFTLGKEAQQIERVLDHFSQRFFKYSKLQDTDSCFFLSYTILMLQSNLHNPLVKEKMTFVDFAKLCTTVKDIRSEQLEVIYNSVKNTKLSEKPQLSSEYVLEKAFYNPYATTLEVVDFQIQSESILSSIWQYLYAGLVDRANVPGLEEAVILYGLSDMKTETEAFLRYLVKLAEEGKSDAYDALLHLSARSIKSLGPHIHLILKFVFQMQEGSLRFDSSLDVSIVDVIFTSTVTLPESKFVQLLQSICRFAYSDVKDSKYSRQVFVLKHLIEIIDYNLPRIQDVWASSWRILEEFFIRMCLHPVPKICMSALDSLKQVTLKLIKIPEKAPFEQRVFMSPFLDVFDRSNTNIKELIVSILGMCICKELQSGWEVIFDILQKADNEDVIRVINRIVEVGLHNMLDPHSRLHSIIINKVTLGVVNDLALDLLVKITQFFDTQEQWLESLRTVRNKFKGTLNLSVLRRFFSILALVKNKSQEVFEQVYDLNLFASESGASEAHEIFKESNGLEASFLLENFSKVVELWSIQLESDNKLIYLEHFQFQVVKLGLEMSAGQLEHTFEYLIKKLHDSNPSQLLAIRKLDEDFEKLIDSLPAPSTGTNLIELDLEKDYYYFLCILHVVVLETLLALLEMRIPEKDLDSLITQTLVQQAESSYNTSSMFNERVILRIFLWRNNFIRSRKLPGLMKHEILSLNLQTALKTPSNIQQHASKVITAYLNTITLLQKLNQPSSSHILRDIYRQELQSKIENMKSCLSQLMRKMGTFKRLMDPVGTYNLVLDLVEAVECEEIIRAAHGPLRLLLEQTLEPQSSP